MDTKTIDQMCDKLSHLVADTFVLYVKTLNFHWNMVSPQFFMYHKLLQSQYEGLQELGDELAERIRQFQRTSPGSMAEFIKLSCLKESPTNLTDREMIEELVSVHEKLVEHCREAIGFADSIEDHGTSDLLVQQMRDHDKQAWLLRSHLTSA
ncbi:MAG: DNA protection during starvation protein 2 [Chlamydiales bacterium]|nr:DNA protection during starvation protein 2 [Chlamydiales bacterium]MCH9619256.1 DNA protection during starvation protein 2 [Chlamydiales bacterium]MCH9622518.1 DNA protection during starvation protein 2 [Chlamydiales bacterium]